MISRALQILVLLLGFVWLVLPLAAQELDLVLVGWSPDGSMLAVSSGSTVKIVDAESLVVLNTLSGFLNQGSWGTLPIAWSLSSKLAVGTGEDVQIWDEPWNPGVTEPMTTIPDSVSVDVLTWRSIGEQLAISRGGVTTIWNVTSPVPTMLHEFPSAADPISQVAWSPDGSYLAESAYDGLVSLWNTDMWGYIGTFKFRLDAIYPDPVNDLSWRPDGKRIAIATDHRIHIGNPSNFVILAEIRSPGNHIRAIAWSPDGTQIATGGWDGAIYVWDANTGEQLAAYQNATSVLSVAWSPDSSKLAYSGTDGEAVIVEVPLTRALQGRNER